MVRGEQGGPRLVSHTLGVHRSLLDWYDAHRRDLPWRRTHDPYAIWVSEIMLQQTQVATVIPFFERWMARFPTVAALAAADEQDVLAMWQGLGYYRRCRFLLLGARYVVANGMPVSAAAWRLVPGVGPYTAGAISSIAFGEPAPLVDGNVERVFARLTGCDLSEGALTAAAWKWAEREVHGERPGDWNQALMELGATVCKPVEPLCASCPVSDLCVAFRDGLQASLPVAARKAKTVELTHITWAPCFEGRFGIHQIPENEWWHGMWEFPRVSSLDRVSELQALFPDAWVESLGSIRHTVTNHKIRLVASVVRVDSCVEGLRWVTVEELAGVAMPAPQRRVLKLATALLGL